MNEITQRLFDLQDLKYRDFQCRLMPNVAPEKVIGVRTPLVRSLARELAKTPQAAQFIAQLPHEYYEEYNLHGFLIEKIKNFDEALAAVDRFLPYVDNWATCDCVSPVVFKKNLPCLYEQIKLWLASGATYTVRYGIGMLMRHYLDDSFLPEYAAEVAAVQSEEYYVNMMRAWYFATALAKQYDAVIDYITEYRLDNWTHNKTIQKAVESYRITDEQKQYLKSCKIVN